MARVPPSEATAQSSVRSRAARKGTAGAAASRHPPTASQLASATAVVMHSTCDTRRRKLPVVVCPMTLRLTPSPCDPPPVVTLQQFLGGYRAPL